MNWVFMLGIGFYFMQNNQYVLMAIIVLQSIVTIFALITLPVEFDASTRGLEFIQGNRITRSEAEDKGAKEALTWAGLTYFVAALAAVAQLAYFILRFSAARRNDD